MKGEEKNPYVYCDDDEEMKAMKGLASVEEQLAELDSKVERLCSASPPRSDKRRMGAIIFLLLVLVATSVLGLAATGYLVNLHLASRDRGTGTEQDLPTSRSVTDSVDGESFNETTLTATSTTTEASTTTAAPSTQWQLNNCRTGENVADGIQAQVILDANWGSWPANKICMAYRESAFKFESSYSLSASFNEMNEFRYGHPGVVYNYRDDRNFDWAYVRTHATGNLGECVSMVNGNIVWQGAILRQAGNDYKAGSWNTMKAEVSGSATGTSTAAVHLNGRKISDCKTAMPAVGAGGVLVANGYGNVFRFKDFSILT